MALGLTYLRAIELAGGVPVVLPPLDDGLDRCSTASTASACPAGPTSTPPPTAPAPHEQLGPTEPALDRFELELARAADAAGMPLLGICRGAQALNVARGGTLHQHVEGHRQTELAHPADALRADRAALARSRAARRPHAPRVNSFHHQAVDVLGDGLAPPRGRRRHVEAIEDRATPFLLGVQWHAETLVDDRAARAVPRARRRTRAALPGLAA